MRMILVAPVLVLMSPSNCALNENLICDHYSGCHYPDSETPGSGGGNIDATQLLSKIFVQPQATTDLLFDASRSRSASSSLAVGLSWQKRLSSQHSDLRGP